MKRVDHAPRFGSFAGGSLSLLGSAKVGEDMLSRRHEVPDFRISARNRAAVSGRRGSFAFVDFSARVWRDLVRNLEIGCAVSCLAASGRSDEARVSPLMDLQTGAGYAAPGDDLAGMGQPIKTKETK